MSGEELARTLGIDGGTARRMIRKAKQNPEFADLPWRQDVQHKRLRRIDGVELFGLLQPPEEGPAILIFDIETAPALGWVWAAYDTDVIAIEQDGYMLSFAYKWLNRDEIDFVSIKQDPAFAPDTTNDLYVVERLAALLDAADVVVAHNGTKFDKKKANQRFLYWDIEPPSPYRLVDTLSIVKREFSHLSSALNELGRIYNLGRKEQHTGFDLWRRCMKGEVEAWNIMERYNRRDVELLERLYIKLLPWIGSPGHNRPVNHGFWHKGKMVCPTCGHDKLDPKGVYRTRRGEYQMYRCQRCRGYARNWQAEKAAPEDRVQLV